MAFTRTGNRIQVPGLDHLDTGVGVVLDGEVVAAAGRSVDFYSLAGELSRRRGRPARPVQFVAFDVLEIDGHMTVDLSYEDWRRLLVELAVPAPVTTIHAWPGEDLGDLLVVCEDQGVEGVVVKDLGGRYHPGRRSRAWTKLKCGSWRQQHARRRVPKTSTT